MLVGVVAAVVADVVVVRADFAAAADFGVAESEVRFAGWRDVRNHSGLDCSRVKSCENAAEGLQKRIYIGGWELISVEEAMKSEAFLNETGARYLALELLNCHLSSATPILGWVVVPLRLLDTKATGYLLYLSHLPGEDQICLAKCQVDVKVLGYSRRCLVHREDYYHGLVAKSCFHRFLDLGGLELLPVGAVGKLVRVH